MYALVRTNTIENARSRPYPPDDRRVSNYHRLPDGQLAADGWLPVIDADLPDHDPDTQRVRHAPRDEWQVESNQVVRTWTVEDRVTPKQIPNTDGFFDSLDDALSRQVTRSLLRDYPDISHALQRERWSRAWEGFADAVDSGVLSEEQAQTVSDLAGEYHIPRQDDEDEEDADGN